jgi:hypothetical protein
MSDISVDNHLPYAATPLHYVACEHAFAYPR